MNTKEDQILNRYHMHVLMMVGEKTLINFHMCSDNKIKREYLRYDHMIIGLFVYLLHSNYIGYEMKE